MKSTIVKRTLVTLAILTVPTAAPAGAATSVRRGAERLTLTGDTIGTKDSPIHLDAAGVINGVGTVTLESSADNRVDHMTLRLRQGAVRLLATEHSFAIHPNLRKCVAIATGQGSFRITGGTGAFRDARGHGTYHRRSRLIGARSPSGACLGNSAPPKAIYYKIVMTGTAALP